MATRGVLDRQHSIYWVDGIGWNQKQVTGYSQRLLGVLHDQSAIVCCYRDAVACH